MLDYHFAEKAAPTGAPLLVLLHGTGGDETSLLDIGGQLLPGAHLVAPRGDVSEGGALRFFRRTAEGVYDMADLKRATGKMASFIAAQAAATGTSRVMALGYSNGANILAAVLFERPDLIERAVLMHPLIPFLPAPQPGLAGHRVLITAGRADPICPAALTERLERYLAAQGAVSHLFWHEGGHEIRQAEFLAARDLLSDRAGTSG